MEMMCWEFWLGWSETLAIVDADWICLFWLLYDVPNEGRWLRTANKHERLE